MCISQCVERAATERVGHSEYTYLSISGLGYDLSGRGGIAPRVLRYMEVGSCDISAS